jgi:hypothetical protein
MTGRPDGRRETIQTDDEDVRRGFWQTDCSIRLDYGGRPALILRYQRDVIKQCGA